MAAQSAKVLFGGAAANAAELLAGGGGAALGRVGLVLGFWFESWGRLVGWNRREAVRGREGELSMS